MTPSTTPSPVTTATPAPSATPFGGTGFKFIYTDWGWNLQSFGEGTVLTKEQVETAIGRRFDYAEYVPSPDFSTLTIKVWRDEPAYTEYLYVSPISLEAPTFLASGRPASLRSLWSPDGTTLLYIPSLTSGNTMYLAHIEPPRTIPVAKIFPLDGFPSWLPDSSGLLWTKNGQLRVIDASTGDSIPLTVDWLEDPLYIYQFEFSPSGDRVMFQDSTVHTRRRIYNTDLNFAAQTSISINREDGATLSELHWSPDGNWVLLSFYHQVNCDNGCKSDWMYYLLDPRTLQMSEVELAKPGRVEYYEVMCGFTPDGKNLVLASDSSYYFFDIGRQQITYTLQVEGGCPFWLPGPLETDD